MQLLGSAYKTALIILCCSQFSAFGKDVSFIGLNQNGDEREVRMNSPLFQKQLENITTTYHDSTMKALGKFGVPGTWRFNSVMVGAEVVGEMGLGDLLKGNAGAKVEFYFNR